MPIIDNFIVPYQRNVHFTGREQLIASLCTKLCEITPKQWNHRVALFGLGGIGKTQLALEYVYSHRDSYEFIFWISAVSETTLLSSFQEIARRTQCVPNTDALSPSEVAKNVLWWLNRQQKWLLVIDNLDNLEVVDSYLPDASLGKHTLITTRNQHCHHIPAEGLEVKELDIQDATELLVTRSNVGQTPEILNEARSIVNELGCLPLAIEQAASYIRETSKNIFTYLPSYRKNRTRHHARTSEGNRNYYKETVATTWQLSFNQIEKRNKDASRLLELLAFLNPDGILIDFLETGKEGLDAVLRDVIQDHDRFFEALSQLEKFSLIGRQNHDTNAQRITIHRLVQLVIKDAMPPEVNSTTTTALIGLCDSAFPKGDYGDFEARMLSRRFQDQVAIPLSTIQGISNQFAYLVRRVGRFLINDGKYQQAIELLVKASQLLEEGLGSEHPDTLMVMAILASAYQSQGRANDALPLSEKVLEVWKRIYGDDSPATLNAMLVVAWAYEAQGRWGEAAKLEENVLEQRKILLGEEDLETLRSMRNLASTYRKQGRYEEAAELNEKCLAGRQRVLGEEHPSTLSAMSSLAATYRMLNQVEKSLALGEKSLEVIRRVLGEEHPNTLTEMGNLAVVYGMLSREKDERKLAEKVLEGRLKLQGPDHPHTLIAMTNLGIIYMNLGMLDESAAMLTRSVEALGRTLGDKHPDTLVDMATLGEVYRRLRRLDDSIEILEKTAVEISTVLGKEHSRTLTTMRYLSKAYRDAGKFDDPFKLLENCRITRESFRRRSP